MKKHIASLTLFAVLLQACKADTEVTPSTPVTITQADFPNIAPGKSSIYFDVNLTASPLTLPSSGANLNLDYSKVAESTISTNNYLTPVANSAFPTATYMRSGTLAVAANTTTSYNDYFGIDASGRYQYGTAYTAYTLSYPSLGAALNYPAQNVTVTPKSVLQKFPITYKDSLTQTYTTNLNFTANAPAYGLNNTPGYSKSTVQSTSKIIGWGNITLKGVSGSKRMIMEDLTITSKVNYFLGGAPAPPTLLALLGATDGQTYTTRDINFYAEGLGFVGSIGINPTTKAVEYSYFRKF